jgi:predicted component of type VI protein secretion system
MNIPSKIMILKTRECGFESLGFIPLLYYTNRD